MFGASWVEEKSQGGKSYMRLKNLPELKEYFEEEGRFIFLQGEEISDSFEKHVIHINGINLEELIRPQHGISVRDTIQRNFDAIMEQGRRLNRPVLAHLNHPNYHWSITAEDLAAIRGEQFFEVYNGHPGTKGHGDDQHPNLDSLWDTVLTTRLHVLGLELLYGLATDDAHHYFQQRVGRANSGRGWIMVRAEKLNAENLIEALRAGDFYASSGVIVNDFSIGPMEYRVDVKQIKGVEQEVQFIGTRSNKNGLGTVGEVLKRTKNNPAVYRFKGDELYVRAKVVSSKLHPNPYARGDRQSAWLQPVKGAMSFKND